MLESAAARYTQVRDATATPGELLLALYDGVFRFLNGAKDCIEKNQRSHARELLSKAQAIISELYIALDHAVAAELCGNLARVYEFCLDRMRLASRNADPLRVDEVIRVLTPLREAWRIAVPKATQESYAAARGK
jgi:flagellar protein FliS